MAESGGPTMKLLELSSDRASFRTLRFNPSGVTTILGEGSQDGEGEGSSNGVGKTLALCLVHHCLGANVDGRLKNVVPEWKFRLRFEHAGTEHFIERLGKGGGVSIDEKKSSQKGLREWLTDLGIFTFDPGIPNLSFRSLIKRFSRVKRDDCVDPLRLNKEPDFDAELRSLYLLGLDCSLAARKQAIKFELDAIKQTSESWKNDGLLRDMFRSGAAPKLRAEWLDREVPRLRAELERFQVADNYREIQLNASKLTEELRELDLRDSVLTYKRSMIERSLADHPDITRKDLLDLYSGVQHIFKPETLAHFEAVEQFHKSLAASRKERLGQELTSIATETSDLIANRSAIAKERDAKLESLHGKRALDEYASAAKQLAALEEESKRITEFLTFNTRLQERAQEQREARVEQDRAAADYLALNPVGPADAYFKELAEVMYPKAPSGILLENNTGDNQIRFNLLVEIEGDDSDGINSARVLCFDWLLLMHGAHHAVDFLWHDNRIFAHIDPVNRAAWFANALKGLPGTGKQYIATINTENYAAMQEHLAPEDRSALDETINLRLSGESPESKLLGIQFG
jgi:uncharacterized protein YydD (DUF2326 family)